MVRTYNSPRQSATKIKCLNKSMEERLTKHVTFKLMKPIPTTKLAIQLTNTAIAIALGLGPCENSSAVIIHGIEPGPTAKNTTNPSVETTDR